MIKKPVKIQLSEGLDARPIALLVQEASQYSSSVYIEVDQKQVNAKSIMGMMSLNLIGGEEITVVTEGEDEEKAAEMTDKYQRLMAEFENARKRNAKEQSHMYDVGAKEVLAKLLPVVDNFERGLDALSEEEKEGAFAQGFIKIYQQMITVLEEIGVKPMDAVGKEFNPDFHNAVMHEENEEMGENLVSEEFQKGYMYKDGVLRHSMVKVVN